MKSITLSVGVSLATGFLGHILFYPVIETWRSGRLRKLARSAIGVIINSFPFLMWSWLFSNDDDDDPHYLSHAMAAYLLSFMWVGTGVILGYVVGDWKKK